MSEAGHGKLIDQALKQVDQLFQANQRQRESVDRLHRERDRLVNLVIQMHDGDTISEDDVLYIDYLKKGRLV